MLVGIYFVLVAAACSMQLTSAAVVKNITDDEASKITFPGPIQDLSNRYSKENITDPCEGLSFCTEKPDDYPQELFNKMFKGKFKEPVFHPTPIMLDDRQGDPDEIEDCDSTISFEPIYKVRSLTGNWLKVVQAAEENFVQMVRLETCNKPDNTCFSKFQAPDDLVAYCKQSYNEWEFLVYDDNGGTKREKVHLPVCCSCHFKPK